MNSTHPTVARYSYSGDELFKKFIDEITVGDMNELDVLELYEILSEAKGDHERFETINTRTQFLIGEVMGIVPITTGTPLNIVR